MANGNNQTSFKGLVWGIKWGGTLCSVGLPLLIIRPDSIHNRPESMLIVVFLTHILPLNFSVTEVMDSSLSQSCTSLSTKNLLCEISKSTKIHIYFLKISNSCLGSSTFWPLLLQLTSLFYLWLYFCLLTQQGTSRFVFPSQVSATEASALSLPPVDSKTIPRAWLTSMNVYNYQVEDQYRYHTGPE